MNLEMDREAVFMRNWSPWRSSMGGISGVTTLFISELTRKHCYKTR